jgi:hypothetical protein
MPSRYSINTNSSNHAEHECLAHPIALLQYRQIARSRCAVTNMSHKINFSRKSTDANLIQGHSMPIRGRSGQLIWDDDAPDCAAVRIMLVMLGHRCGHQSAAFPLSLATEGLHVAYKDHTSPAFAFSILIRHRHFSLHSVRPLTRLDLLT